MRQSTALPRPWLEFAPEPIQVAPASLHANVGLVHPPRSVGRLEMPTHALLQFWTVPLQPLAGSRIQYAASSVSSGAKEERRSSRPRMLRASGRTRSANSFRE